MTIRATIVGVLAVVYGSGQARLPAAEDAPIHLSATPIWFLSAKPVWLQGRATEMNVLAGFRAVFPRPAEDDVRLRVACSTIYRGWINGQYVARGPARAAHGYYRVDEWDLTPYLKDGPNVIALEVAGYNANGYQLLDQPSFLQAEVASGARVLASTAGTGMPFTGRPLPDRVQKVPRYSFQRLFTEVYRLQPDYDRWRSDPLAEWQPAVLSEVGVKNLLPRRVPLPKLDLRRPVRQVVRGTMVPHPAPAKPWKDRALVNIGPKLKGFPEAELTACPSLEIQQFATRPQAAPDGAGKSYDPQTELALATRDYRILDLGLNATGMLGAEVTCVEPTRLWFVFDEILTDGDVDFKRLSCVNLISYRFEPGTYRVESLEPYTLRYLKLICVEGQCTIRDVYLRQYRHAGPKFAEFTASDPRLNQLYAAGVETFRQNSLDLFMDCPSRERAGWLCDSFFTARVAFDVTGNTRIEDAFFENFLLPSSFVGLPAGMLPMCYPADHYDGVFIPNWALWFVVQLEEYAARTGDRGTVDALRPKVQRLFDYFQPFENQDGLLEKLAGWVFVEWSAANKFVQDVNYPSNMLYAGALDAAARLYDSPAWHAKAERIRGVVRAQAFDGQFFVDNAERRDGKLVVTRNRSEVCQYFAFFFQVATPETHAPLWRTLRDEFGPTRQQTQKYPEVHFANSFIGNVLRLELLSQAGLSRQILDESVAYLLYMAQRTGTLWENDGAYASCNHGFASHVVHTLYRDILGIYRVDVPHRQIEVRLGTAPLDWCEGTLATPDGPLHLRWQQQGAILAYRLDPPPGYRVIVTNPSGKPLQPLPAAPR